MELSLRLGITYEAACWALVTCEVLTRQDAARLQAATVEDLKRTFAPAASIANSRADVWSLTAADTRTFLEAAPDDLFVVHVQDHASAGYVWRLVDATGKAKVVGERPSDRAHAYGARSTRMLYVRLTAPGVHHLVFEHVRPWSRATVARIDIDIDGHGRERAGWARRMRSHAVRLGA